jgi:hypothetical protein
MTHMPLWGRSLNDELNCNACGLSCKLLCVSFWFGMRTDGFTLSIVNAWAADAPHGSASMEQLQ